MFLIPPKVYVFGRESLTQPYNTESKRTQRDMEEALVALAHTYTHTLTYTRTHAHTRTHTYTQMMMNQRIISRRTQTTAIFTVGTNLRR